MSGFNFGTGNSNSGSSLFGGAAKTTASSNTGGGFSFGGGGGSSNPPSSGFSFGGGSSNPPSTAPAAAAPSGSFSFGGGNAAPAATTASTLGGFSLTGNAASTTPSQPPSFSLGGTTTSTSSTLGGFSLGGSQPSAGAFSFGGGGGATTTTSQASKPAFGGFGAKADSSTGSSLPTPSATSLFPQNTSTPLPKTATTTTTAAAPAAATTTTAAASKPAPSLGGFSFPTTATTNATTTAAAPKPTFGLGSTTAAVTTAPLTSASPPKSISLGTIPTPAATTTTTAAGSLFTGAASTTTAAAAPKPTSDISWSELENKITRWNTDIEQQVSVFLKQATQVNAWSSLLLANGEKISDLCGDLEKVKKQQNELDNELDKVASQQAELEAILAPLEEAAARQKSSSMHNVDTERERTYNLAGSVDAQIKSLAAELREVIERINSQQGDGGNSNLSQVTQILSSHTDALQWVEEQSASLQRRLEQVTRAVDTRAAIDQRNF